MTGALYDYINTSLGLPIAAKLVIGASNSGRTEVIDGISYRDFTDGTSTSCVDDRQTESTIE